MKCLALMVLGLLATTAFAEQWVEVGSDNESAHYVDRDSFSRTDDLVTLKKKVVYNIAQVSSFTRNGESIKYSIGTIQEDCRGHQHRVVSIELFGAGPEAIWSSGNLKRIWESVEPESIGASTQNIACTVDQ